MPSIEITAKSVEEARTSGAARLGVAPEAVSVNVIEETKGLFGKSQLRVKVETIESDPTPRPLPVPSPSPILKSKREPAEAAPTRKRTGKAEAKAPEPVAPAPEPEPEPVPVEEAKPARGARRGKAPAPKPEETVAAPVAAPAPEEERTEAVATEEDGKNFVALIEELMKAADLQVTAKVAGLQGRYVNISLDGKDSSHLVGKHGEVLNALQYLVNILSNRRYGNGVRSSLECNDYRQRREETLSKMAQKVAEQVIERREEAVLEALPAYERRIVHKVISEMDGVETYSEGEEPNRRVVIAPRG